MRINNTIKLYTSTFVISILLTGSVSAIDLEAATYYTQVDGHHRRVANHKEIIGADNAHSQNIFGKGVKVAVIDDVFDFGSDTESALTQSCMLLAPKKGSFTFNQRQNDAVSRGHNHANHVSSTIAGKDGIAPQAQLRVIDLRNDPATRYAIGNDQKMANAIHQAIASKANLISISMRIAPDHNWNGKISKVVKQAFYAARDAGIGIIKSAGNDGEMTGDTAYTKSLAKLLSKMNGHMRLAVATGYDASGYESLAGFSNHAGIAAQYVLAAPGKDILAFGANNKKVSMSGTSMAAPVLSSAAALLMSTDHKRSAAQVFDLLDRSARKTNLATGSILSPQSYGQGVVNVTAALKLADQESKTRHVTTAAQSEDQIKQMKADLLKIQTELDELKGLQAFLERAEDIRFVRNAEQALIAKKGALLDQLKLMK